MDVSLAPSTPRVARGQTAQLLLPFIAFAVCGMVGGGVVVDGSNRYFISAFYLLGPYKLIVLMVDTYSPGAGQLLRGRL